MNLFTISIKNFICKSKVQSPKSTLKTQFCSFVDENYNKNYNYNHNWNTLCNLTKILNNKIMNMINEYKTFIMILNWNIKIFKKSFFDNLKLIKNNFEKIRGHKV